ncbi:hypothetical protein ANO11243_020100 [Dothideomycetidae sp. 11243]|nr:hypothetical protein ANO11243_020100 [fungal sp. No.11243]
MATQVPYRPLASLTQSLSQLRLDTPLYRRTYATTSTPSSEPQPPPSTWARPHNFHPGNIYRNHREKSAQFRPLPVPRSAPHIKKTCPDPVAAVTASQLAVLDPKGQRTRLFSQENPERVNPGDVILVRQAGGLDPISGVVLAIRRKTPVDAAVLLRNALTRVAVEVWVKIYSPNVTGIEVVQRKEKRARRNKLYYYRSAKHDMGSLEGMVRTYLRARSGLGQKAAVKSKGGKKR